MAIPRFCIEREGKSRTGHFSGVATIVTKLFNIVQPTNAYFGQKDAVQCVLIKRIVDDLNMDVNVQIMDTIRESDGLAMSSRNAYLLANEREKAPIIYKSLFAARGGTTYVLEQMYFISYQVCLILLVVEFCNTLSNNRLVCCIVSQLSFKEGPTKTTSRPRPIMHLVPT